MVVCAIGVKTLRAGDFVVLELVVIVVEEVDVDTVVGRVVVLVVVVSMKTWTEEDDSVAEEKEGVSFGGRVGRGFWGISKN